MTKTTTFSNEERQELHRRGLNSESSRESIEQALAEIRKTMDVVDSYLEVSAVSTMASEAFEKWWNEKPVSARLGAVHGSSGDLAEEAWTAAVEACAAAVETAGCACGLQWLRAHAGTQPDSHEDSCPQALAARLRRLA